MKWDDGKGFLIIISELELLAMCELCDWLKSAKRKLEARNSLLDQAKVKKKKQSEKCGRKKQGDIVIVSTRQQHSKMIDNKSAQA